MKVGVICEGMGDFAVIRNVVKSLLGIDYSDVKGLRPKYDATEISLRKQGEEMPPEERSNWTLVRDECINKQEIDKFINSGVIFTDSRKILIVHLDTDRCEDKGYDVKRPPKSGSLKEYTQKLRNAVIAKINEWLGEIDLTKYIVYAIAIEETEAWLIPLYNKALRKDTCYYNNPKLELDSIHGKKGLGTLNIYDRIQVLSNPIIKRKELAYCCEHNESLRLFVEELQNKVNALPMEE